MPDLTHIEPERRERYSQIEQYKAHDEAGISSVDLEYLSLIYDLQRAREETLTFRGLLAEVYEQVGNHRPAERRHALTPGLRDRIRDTIFVTCPRCSGAPTFRDPEGLMTTKCIVCNGSGKLRFDDQALASARAAKGAE